MDMYQTRKVRKEQNINKQEETNSKMNINWVKVIYENSIKNVDI